MWDFGTFEYFYKGIVSSLSPGSSQHPDLRGPSVPSSPSFTPNTPTMLCSGNSESNLNTPLNINLNSSLNSNYHTLFSSSTGLSKRFGVFFFPFFAYLFGEVSWHLYKPCHGLRFKYFHMPCFFQIFHCVYKKKMFMKFTFIKMQRCNRAVKQPAARKSWLNSTKTSSRDEHVSAWSKYLPWWCEAAILDITTVPSCRQYDSKTGVMIGVRTQLFLHKVVLKLH